MKKFIAAALLACAPVFATSMIHPLTASKAEIKELLEDKVLGEVMFKFNEGIVSLAEHKKGTWTIKTEKHDCEVVVTLKQIGVGHSHGGIGGGPIMKREFTITHCR